MEEDLIKRKKQIRKHVLTQRREMTSEEASEKSVRIFENVRKSAFYQNAKAVFAYVDMPRNHEVVTRSFIEQAWKDGKKVAVPKCENGEMTFWYIDDWGQLESGMMGILEPITHCPGIVKPADGDEDALMIMPGVAFDGSRHRIGFGGGYYDKYLARHPKHPTIAAAFDFQVVDSVPAEETDIRPQAIMTESRIY